MISKEPEYAPAEYLKEMTHFLSLPLEPALGNISARNSQKVIFRLFPTSYAVDLGTSFARLAEGRGEKAVLTTYAAYSLTLRPVHLPVRLKLLSRRCSVHT